MEPLTRTISRQGDEDRLVTDVTMGRNATQLATVQVRANRQRNTDQRPEPGSTERNLNPNLVNRLPVDAGGMLVPEHWERWLAEDPVRLAPLHAQALRGLCAVYLDAGDADEYYMDLGTAKLSEVLTGLGVAHRCERFPGRHGGVSWRYPIAYDHLARALA